MGFGYSVVDWKDQEIRVGLRCLYGDDVVEVTAISDPDGDVDDYGRSIMIYPYISIRFMNGDVDKTGSVRITPITWADYPDGPNFELFQVDDLEVIE
jgi:hypothetical protein